MVDFTRRGVVPAGLEAVRAAGALDRCRFVTGNVEALRRLRALSSEARPGLTWVEGARPPLALLAELSAEYWNPMSGLVTPRVWRRCTTPGRGCRRGPSTNPRT
jgi:hypothetical protein